MCSTTPPAIGQGQGLAFLQGGSAVFVLIFITLSIIDDKYSHMSGKSAQRGKLKVIAIAESLRRPLESECQFACCRDTINGSFEYIRINQLTFYCKVGFHLVGSKCVRRVIFKVVNI